LLASQSESAEWNAGAADAQHLPVAVLQLNPL
jgi:hypothetical protein